MGEPPEDPFAPLVAVHEDFVDKLTELEATLDEMMATRETREGNDIILDEAVQFLLEEPNGLIEDDVVPFARLAGGHHLVQGRLEFRELVDEILVHRDERSERILRRLAHRSRLRPVVLKACASRREPARRPRERYGVSDVVELADPLDEALHPHPEARVLHAAEAAGVEIPLVRLRVLSLFLEAFLDCLQVRLPLAASDDLADAIAADHVEREDEVRMLRVTGLVEGLGDSRIVSHDDRPRFAFREGALLERAEVLAPFNVHHFLLQD